MKKWKKFEQGSTTMFRGEDGELVGFIATNGSEIFSLDKGGNGGSIGNIDLSTGIIYGHKDQEIGRMYSDGIEWTE
ncbi:MAG: hypothetical protein FWF46_02700 [Oscillospiraceae bacterium]|nr:hypothetical protein [Oscillospiraceae bacterium]